MAAVMRAPAGQSETRRERYVAISLTGSLFPTASPADREAASAVLTASIAHYWSVFAQGQAIIHAQHAKSQEVMMAMEVPNSVAARFRYYLENLSPERGMGFLDAFRQADKHFTADNEPQAIRDWVNDMSFMHDDLSRWMHVAAHYYPAH